MGAAEDLCAALFPVHTAVDRCRPVPCFTCSKTRPSPLVRRCATSQGTYTYGCIERHWIEVGTLLFRHSGDYPLTSAQFQ